MKKEEFVSKLSERVRDNVAEYLFQDVVFNVQDEFVLFQPLTRCLSDVGGNAINSELPTVHGSSWRLIYDIMIGDAELLDAFQSKQISTNGYLPQLFVLMIVFQPTRSAQIPE